jgi:carboxypeptidase C (cathepsin A)
MPQLLNSMCSSRTCRYQNNYTWNSISNMLFLEAPAGVGFSYSNTKQGTVHNDSSTAQDNLNAGVLNSTFTCITDCVYPTLLC